MEIIDAHAHIYPEKIAEKATVAIGDFYDIPMEMPAGTAESLNPDFKKVFSVLAYNPVFERQTQVPAWEE